MSTTTGGAEPAPRRRSRAKKKAPVTLAIGTTLDIYLVEELHALIQGALHGAPALTLDLGGAEEIHAAALQVLVAAARECAAREIPLALTGAGPALERTLARGGLQRLLPLVAPAEGGAG